MKKLYTFLSLCLLLTTLSCDSDSIYQETQDTALPNGIDSLATDLKTYHANIQSLIQDPNGLVRGFNLGTTEDLIVSKNTSLEKVDTNTYAIQLDAIEAAEYTYYFTDHKVSKIDVYIYPESEYRQGEYERELSNYYSAKFKSKSKKSNKTTIIEVPNQNLKISITKLGNAKVFDLRLTFEPIQ